MTSKLRVLIADDEPLARARLRRLLGLEPGIEIVAEAESGEQVLEGVVRTRPDVLFLDIRMPRLDGFEALAAVLQDAGSDAPACVFVTAFEHYAVRAFDVSALDYLLKPFDGARLRRALDRARQRREARDTSLLQRSLAELLQGVPTNGVPSNKAPVKIPVLERDGTHFVDVPDIEYVESDGNYVQLHTAERAHLVRTTLTAIEARLKTEGFVRVHRSRLVRIDSIRAVSPLFRGEYSITLKSGRTLTSARSHRARLRAALGLS